MDTVLGAKTWRVREAAADEVSILKKTCILNDRKPFFPATNLLDDGAPVGQRGGRRPEFSDQSDLRAAMDVFNATRDPLENFECVRLDLCQPFPVRIGDVRVGFL